MVSGVRLVWCLLVCCRVFALFVFDLPAVVLLFVDWIVVASVLLFLCWVLNYYWICVFVLVRFACCLLVVCSLCGLLLCGCYYFYNLCLADDFCWLWFVWWVCYLFGLLIVVLFGCFLVAFVCDCYGTWMFVCVCIVVSLLA